MLSLLSGTIQHQYAMRKAALLYNPASGGSGRRRQRELESALAVLRAAGVDADLVPTQSPAHAKEETRSAIDSGCDTLFACGGDGTIHNAVHRRIALGCVKYLDLHNSPGQRYFVITAGVGVDAHLFYKLHTGTKQRMGMAAYYAKAWHLWFNYPMTRFAANYVETGSALQQRANVTELLAVRIRNFGGVVQELAPGASLDRDDMRLVFARTASRLAYLAWVTRGLLRCHWNVPGVNLVHSTRVLCDYEPSSAAPEPRKIYVEADGELLGSLPAEITVVPNSLTLLAPAR